MKAAWQMWGNTRMIILVAVCAAIYGAALIAFKTVIPLIPGFTEVRVAGIFIMVFGLLFGPAGAWGLAFGNLIADIFGGTIGPGSLPGFLGNFVQGYLPYAMWTKFVPFAVKSGEWKTASARCWIAYVLISLVSSASCAVIVSIFVHGLGMVPYPVLSKIIMFNNTIGCLVGVLLLIAVYDLTRRHLGLYWKDIMEVDERGPSVVGALGSWVVAIGAIVGLAGGIIAGFPIGIVWLCALAILAGSTLL